MNDKTVPRYSVESNGSKSYFQVIDNNPEKPWERDICTCYGKREKAERIAKGLNLLEAIQEFNGTSTKVQIMNVLKEYLP